MLHIIKLLVGCQNIEELRSWMRIERVNNIAFIRTRNTPKRSEEILKTGGSLYRAMNGFICCRQPILGFETYQREDGQKGTLILVSDEIIPVEPRPIRPFQGWRYFKEEDAPADLSAFPHDNKRSSQEFPRKLLARLSELGVF